MDKILEEHRDFSAILASFVSAWKLEGSILEAVERADGSDTEARCNKTQDDFERRTMLRDYEVRKAERAVAIDVRQKRINAAAAGYLLADPIELEGDGPPPLGFRELAEMAKRVGRLRVIDRVAAGRGATQP
jgi:hypothetical protein